MTDIWRLFIALEIPSNILDQLSALQNQLKDKTPARTVRWIRPEGIHLTLKFLGDVPASSQARLERAVAKAAENHASFTLTATQLGCFPNLNRPRVVWVAIQQDLAALSALRDAIEKHVAPLGYPTDKRPFNPHLTLGRIQRTAHHNDIQRVANLITETGYTHRHSWPVNDVHLIRSELKPTGAEYTSLFRSPLRAE